MILLEKGEIIMKSKEKLGFIRLGIINNVVHKL